MSKAEMPARPEWLHAAWGRLVAMRDKPATGVLLVSPQSNDGHDLAAAWVRLLLCESDQPGDTACGACRSCREIRGGVHPDFMHVARVPEKRDITIDQIREAIDWASRTARGHTRVLYLEHAEDLNSSASNAFLKTLEEPARGLVIVLSCRRLHALPVTMRSRCQRINLPVPSEQHFDEYLAAHGLSASQIHSANALFPGNVGAALKMSEAMVERLNQWERAWRGGVEQGDTIGAAAVFDDDDWVQALTWIQRKMLAWARSPNAAMALEPAWKAIIRMRAMQSISLNRLLLAEELLMLLRSAYRIQPPMQDQAA